MKNVLIRVWRSETNSLIFGRTNPVTKGGEEERAEFDIPTKELAPHVRSAEEFFVLPYLAFIQNILGRLRTIALGSLWLFVGTTLAVSSYPFDPLSALGGIFLGVFIVVGINFGPRLEQFLRLHREIYLVWAAIVVVIVIVMVRGRHANSRNRPETIEPALTGSTQA